MGKIFKALEKSQQNTPDEHKKEETPSFESSSKPVISETFAEKEDFSGVINLKIDPKLVSALAPQSIEAEQIRLLKNSILFPEKGTPPKSIMVNSASPGEGKSFVASNLAISIAQNIDEYVFLMDCDLRSPSIHSLFGLPDNTLGLSDYLLGEKPLSSLLIKTFLNKLTLLAAGKSPLNPSELLSSEQMRHLIREVKLRYEDRYIIIDTPPPYLTSETNAIARQVDGIIIVVQQGRTRKKEVEDLIALYGRDKIIGVVNNFAKKRFGPDYGKYGYSKYGYGVKNA